MGLSISKNSILAILNYHSGNISFLDTSSLEVLEKKKIKYIFNEERYKIMFSADDQSLFTWGGIGSGIDGIDKYDYDSGELIWTYHVNQPSEEIAESNNKKILAIASVNNEVHIIDNFNGNLIKIYIWKNASKKWNTEVLGFSQDDNFLYLKDGNKIGKIDLKNFTETNKNLEEGTGYSMWLNQDNDIFHMGNQIKSSKKSDFHFISCSKVIGYSKFNINSVSNNNKIIGLTYSGDYANASNHILLVSMITGKIISCIRDKDSTFEVSSLTIDDVKNKVFVEYENSKVLVFDIDENNPISNQIVLNLQQNNYSSIFLSHSSIDKTKVRKIYEDLTRRGVKVWFDEAEIDIGDSIVRKISEGIENMDYLGIVLTKNSIKSKWVKEELEIALNEQISLQKTKVLPILLEDCEIPLFLKGKLYVDCRDKNYSHAINQIEKRLIINKGSNKTINL